MSLIRTGFFRAMIVVVCMSFFVGVPTMIQAAAPTTCVCYCAVDGTGAVKQSTVTPVVCQETCKNQGRLVAACAFSSSQLPAENNMCFTQSECTAQGGTFDSGFQPGECLQSEKYCFPSSTGAKVTLQVSIGSLTSPEDFGEYVAAGYKWMLGSATLIAIVFIMVSGLQLTFAVVSAEQVGKAKKRIVNSVAGLVLLLSTYLILQTVNPNLLKLQVPDFPMIKTVALVNGNTSCGYLVGVWGTSSYLTTNGAPIDSPHSAGQPAPKGGKPYTVTASGTNCGDVGTITKDWEGNSVTPEGQTCKFDYCPTNERCYAYSGGGECLTCGEVVNGNRFVTPSSSVCEGLSLRTTVVGSGQLINRCFWTRDGSMIPGISAGNLITSDGSCAMLTLNCNQITSCGQYDTLALVANNATSGQLESIQFDGTPSDTIGGPWGDESLTSICNEDPCEVSKRPEMAGKKCFSEYVTRLIDGNDCDTIIVDASLVADEPTSGDASTF